MELLTRLISSPQGPNAPTEQFEKDRLKHLT